MSKRVESAENEKAAAVRQLEAATSSSAVESNDKLLKEELTESLTDQLTEQLTAELEKKLSKKIERKYKKKSKVLVLYSVESVEDDLTLFRFAPVSMKFLTEFSHAVVSAGQETREKSIFVQKVLKANKRAFLVVLPFNGDFSVFSLDLG